MLWFLWKITEAALHFQDKSTEIMAPLKIKPQNPNYNYKFRIKLLLWVFFLLLADSKF